MFFSSGNENKNYSHYKQNFPNILGAMKSCKFIIPNLSKKCLYLSDEILLQYFTTHDKYA